MTQLSLTRGKLLGLLWREKTDDWLSGAGGGERKEWEVLV